MTRLRLLLIVALLLGTLVVNLTPLSLTTRDSAIFVAMSPQVALAGDDGINPPHLTAPPQPLGDDGINPPHLTTPPPLVGDDGINPPHLSPPQPLGDDGINPPHLSPYH